MLRYQCTCTNTTFYYCYYTCSKQCLHCICITVSFFPFVLNALPVKLSVCTHTVTFPFVIDHKWFNNLCPMNRSCDSSGFFITSDENGVRRCVNQCVQATCGTSGIVIPDSHLKVWALSKRIDMNSVVPFVSIPWWRSPSIVRVIK